MQISQRRGHIRAGHCQTVAATSFARYRLLVGVLAIIFSSSLWAVPVTFFGQDLNGGTTNTNEARTDFLNSLAGFEVANFESLPGNFGKSAGPTFSSNLFGTTTATLTTISGALAVGTEAEANGGFSPSGTTLLILGGQGISGNPADRGGELEIEFTSPQTAFGFVGTDIGDQPLGNQLSVGLLDANGIEIGSPFTVPHGINTGNDRSAIFFGIIDTANPFFSVRLINSGIDDDGHAFDEFIIAAVPLPGSLLLVLIGLVGLKARPSAVTENRS